MKRHIAYFHSPIGWLRVVGAERNIVEIKFSETASASDSRLPTCIRACEKQLQEYFRGIRKAFHLPLAPAGTDFQMSVWRQLASIPYGQAVSYGDIARRIGNPSAGRAVGAANHANPIAIVIPCHRVIGAGGDLVGYGGALWRKQWLLQHEKAVFNKVDQAIRYASPPPDPAD